MRSAGRGNKAEPPGSETPVRLPADDARKVRRGHRKVPLDSSVHFAPGRRREILRSGGPFLSNPFYCKLLNRSKVLVTSPANVITNASHANVIAVESMRNIVR